MFCSNGLNCMTNEGSYVSSWADHYNGTIGQAISPDEQCKLILKDTNRIYRAVSSTQSYNYCDNMMKNNFYAGIGTTFAYGITLLPPWKAKKQLISSSSHSWEWDYTHTHMPMQP